MTHFKREVKGSLPPIWLFPANTTVGSVYYETFRRSFYNPSFVQQRHIPQGARLVDMSLQLEYLQCNYNIKSLPPVPTADLPSFDPDLASRNEKVNQLNNFYQTYNVQSGHAVEIGIYGPVTNQIGETTNRTGWVKMASEFLFNTGGLWNYLNLLSPYLVKDSEVYFLPPWPDMLLVGTETPIPLLAGQDQINVIGGYSGLIHFWYDGKVELQTRSGRQLVSRNVVEIVPGNQLRKRLYIGNLGDTNLYFRFTDEITFVGDDAPFIPPGESLTIEQGKIHFSSKRNYSSHWFEDEEINSYIIRKRVYAFRKEGGGFANYEEHYSPI